MIIEGVSLNVLRVPRFTFLSVGASPPTTIPADNTRRGVLLVLQDLNFANTNTWTVNAKRSTTPSGPVINVVCGGVNQASPWYYMDVATHGQLVQEQLTFLANIASNDAACWEFFFQN